MRYIFIIRIPHPYDHNTIPANVRAIIDESGMQPAHREWETMPGTRVNQGKRLVMFTCIQSESYMQVLFDDNGLANFEIVAYRTEELFSDPASTDEAPLPNRPEYSRNPVKVDLIDWMNDEYDVNGTHVRPTELRLNIIHGTGQWVVAA